MIGMYDNKALTCLKRNVVMDLLSSGSLAYKAKTLGKASVSCHFIGCRVPLFLPYFSHMSLCYPLVRANNRQSPYPLHFQDNSLTYLLEIRVFTCHVSCCFTLLYREQFGLNRTGLG